MVNEKIYNFEINENPIQPTSENIGYELPYFDFPNWERLDSQYKNSAKGYSEELKGLKSKRLCTYVDIYARPSRESIVIFHSDVNQILRGFFNPIEDKNLFFTLTGLFVDMPEGRFHYVELNSVYKMNTWDMWGKYNRKRPFKYQDSEVGFKYGFVREDLINIDKPIIGYKPISYELNIPVYNSTFYNPKYYDYKYEYYENPEKGLSYLYMLIPRFDYKYEDFIYTMKINRVTAYKNHGNTEILNETNVAPEKKTETNKVLKYTALTAGAIILGRALNG